MTEAAFADWEVSVVLPLGVVASQLARIEAQLRLVNISAVGAAQGRDAPRVTGTLGATLDHINEALDSIRDLVAAFEADIRPKSRPPRDD